MSQQSAEKYTKQDIGAAPPPGTQAGFETEVRRRFGMLPNYFRLPSGFSQITTNLWDFARSSYLDNPLPSLFKERLIVYLSRFCKVRYCITRHLGFLLGFGHASGDPSAPPQSINEVVGLLDRTLPRKDGLRPFLQMLQPASAPLTQIPEPGSALEEALFASAAHVFLQTSEAPKCDSVLQNALEEQDYQYLLLLLAFVRTVHYWSEVQTDLRFESDIEELLTTNKHLAELLLQDQEVVSEEAGRAWAEELEGLRTEKRRNEKLLHNEQVLRRNQQVTLTKINRDLADKVAMLEKASEEAHVSRRAALNLMEDAIASKEALRVNEERMRRQKEAFQSAMNGVPLYESLKILTQLVTQETEGAARTAFYLADEAGKYLHPVFGAGTMPDAYLRQIDGFMIGEDSLACGLAVPTGRPVLTRDVHDEPLWQPWTAIADEFDYRGCWSFPIITRSRKAVGTFAMYFQTAREATANDLALAEVVVQTAAVLIVTHTDTELRARSEAALLDADRRKDEFLAMLAHELRNPMSTIRSGLHFLTLSTEENTKEVDSTVAMMSRQTDYLVRMVDDLLDVSRISRGRIELRKVPVNLVELVALAIESVHAMYRYEHRNVQVDLPPVPIYVDGDATRLAQTVTNLLTNAMRYTSEQGNIGIRLEKQEDEAILRVSDDGIGLSQEHLTEIFELFMQVDTSAARSKGGLGLGLTLVKQLIGLHGGQVEAWSEGIGKGSVFTVRLPTLTGIAASALETASPASASLSSTPIVVIDDNEDATFMIGKLLKLRGYAPYTVNNGREGLEAVENLHPAAVLLDIGMPDLDGYETCRLLRTQPWGQNTIIIALTGYGQKEDMQRTKEAGFDGHLMKPVDFDILIQLLEQLWNHKRNSG